MSEVWLDHQLLPNGRTQVSGHPTAEIELGQETRRMTVCAECGSVRSILFLTGDRWFCTKCRNAGVGGSTSIPVTRPGRESR